MLPDIISYLVKFSSYQDQIKNSIIPILKKFLSSNDLDIKEQAGKILANIAQDLSQEDRGDFVLRHILEMAHDDYAENNRVVAVQLFGNMSECFGGELCEKFIGLEMLSLGDDSSAKVRN